MLDLDTGKYALYIWPAYGITLLVFIAMIWASLGYSRRWRRRAEELKAGPGRDTDA
jgi:heme exporter protein D